MASFKYSVYRIPCSIFKELVEINLNSKIEIHDFLKRRTRDIMSMIYDDSFRSLDDAESFATIVYRHDNSKDIVAIYDLFEKTWINFWVI